MTYGFGGLSDMALLRGRGTYANPHHTVALRDIPTNLKEVMRLCRYYYHTDSLLRAIIDKMSEYPITEIILESLEDQGVDLTQEARERWDYLLNVGLDLRNVMKQINVDKYVFGTSCRYLHLPFVRYAKLYRNGMEFPIKSLRDVRITVVDSGGQFKLRGVGKAKDDGFTNDTEFEIIDRQAETRTGINLTRLNPMRLELAYNPLSGQSDWYWNPPKTLREGIVGNVKNIYETTELRFLEAAWRNRPIELNPDRIWVAQADGFPGLWEGWGVPPLFAVLEDTYYYKILRRANEALAQEHVTPLRFLSPSGTGDVSAQRTLNIPNWQARMRREIMKFRRDPNHVVVAPMPVNIEQMGGQARVMMVASEIEAASRIIAAGLGCPIEMIWGGLNWSGASVSLRVLENHFLCERESSERLLDFLMPRLSTHYRLPRVKAGLADFKMADDVQQQANAINLMTNGFLDRETVIGEMGYAPEVVLGRLRKEHKDLNSITMDDNVAASHMNTVIQAMEAKAQILLQYELRLTEEMAQANYQRQRTMQLGEYVRKLHDKGFTAPVEFEHSAMILGRMQPNMQQAILQTWQQTMPLVTQMLSERLILEGQMGDIADQAMAGGQGPDSFGQAEDAGIPSPSGPFGDGMAPDAGMGMDDQGADLGAADDPLPDQRPPQRDSSPV